jgi:O-antigen ligase
MVFNLIDKRFLGYTLAVLMLAETLSLAAYALPMLNWLVLALIIVIISWLYYQDKRWLLYIPLLEVFWGSLGRSFYWELGGFSLSVRMVIFALTILWWLPSCWRSIRVINWQQWVSRLYLAVLAFLGLSLLLGYLHHNSVTNIFFDSNGYSFLLYYLIWYPLIKDIEWKKIAALFLASSLIISAKTLIIFHIFTHIYDWANIGFLYLWVRDTKVGELTLVTANYWRVFFQSQIYPAAIWLMTIVTMMLVPKIRWSWKMVALSALMFSSVLISLSRSFWLALILTAVIVTLTYIKTIWQQQQKKLRLGLMLTSIILGAGIVAATLFIPPVDSELANAFANRFNNGESAASSRANLAPVMIAGIKQHWLLGSGLGSTLTYKNNDPRIRSMVGPDGSYTTYAFELGWLDFWFKFGLLGLLSWLALIGYALYRGWRLSQRQTGKTAAIISLFAGLTFIAITHAVTPYLNHPLGISYLILCLLFIQYHESQTPSHH